MTKVKETTSFTDSGGMVFVNNLGKAVERIGFEKRFFPSILIGSFFWERAYNSENRPIHSGAQGTVFLPAEVNRYYCSLRLDSMIKESFRWKAPDVDIVLITSFNTFLLSMRLHTINYQVVASHQRIRTVLFESGLTIENKKLNPKIKVFKTEILPPIEWFIHHK